MNNNQAMSCRLGCGACCIAPSITSAIPDMPNGKPAGTRCVQLDSQNLCKLFGKSNRPKVCEQFNATFDVCGKNNADAMWLITQLEAQT